MPLKRCMEKELKAIYDKSSGTAPFNAGLDLNDGFLYRNEDFADEREGIVTENGHKFIVNWEEGQKTGFFLDQRENRVTCGEVCCRTQCAQSLFLYGRFFHICARGRSHRCGFGG
jgi:23S rRNA (cytosine1962-C5)-methyltransferase